VIVNGGYGIYVAGTAENVVVKAPGSSFAVDSGGIVSSGTLSAGVVGQVFESTVADLTISSGGSLALGNDSFANGTILSSGATLNIGQLASATGTMVSNGAVEEDDGYSSGTIIASGGLEQVGLYGNGAAFAAVVEAGGEQDNFGVALGTIIEAGGMQDDYGTASGTTVQAGGLEVVEAGATAIGTTVETCGMLSNNEGTTSGVVLQLGATEQLGVDELAATAVGTIVGSGAAEIVLAGSIASGTILQSGGILLLLDGTQTGTVYDGGVVVTDGVVDYDPVSGYRYMGTVVTGDVLGSGDIQYVVGSGIASGTIVQSGAQQQIYSGGTTVKASVGNGGFVEVNSGGTASGATVSAGGLLGVFSGTAIATDVLQSGAAGELFGGTLIGTIVESGGIAGVLEGGEADGTDVRSGGALAVLGGTTSGTIIESGGVEGVATDFAVGSATGTILEAGGYLVPVSGTVITDTDPLGGTVVQSGVFVVYVESGSVNYGLSATGLSLSNGAEAFVLPGGILNGGTVAGGFTLIEQDGTEGLEPSAVLVEGGGLATGTTFTGTTRLDVFASGSASNVVLTGSASEDVLSGGYDSGVQIGSGTIETVEDGGTSLGAIVSSGGEQYITEFSSSTTNVGDTKLLPGGEIFFPFLYPDSGTVSESYNSATGLFTLSYEEQGAPETRSITLAGNYTDASLVTSASSYDDDAGIFVTAEAVACYLHGTLIDTPDGEQPIETLTIGDLVSTADGPARPIRWIGRRSYDRQFVQGNPDVIPIRIARDAIADGVPHTDLLVSPLHAMFVGGVLIPAKLLVNGVTITEATDIDLIHYVHLELASHDILLANGAPSESFVDCDSRGMFQNEAEYAALYPNNPGPRWVFCAPRIEDGHRLEDIRTEISARGGGSGAGANGAGVHCTGALEGYLDVVNGETVAGWAWQPDHPAEPVRLEIVVDGGVIAQVVANRERGDVRRAGYGTGRYGFELTLPKPLSPFSRHVVQARRVSDKTELGHSPRVLEPMPVLDIAARQALADAIQGHAAGASMEEREDLLGVLVAGTKRLLHARKGPSVVVDGSDVKSRTVKHRRRAQPALLERSGQFALVIDDRMPTPDKDAGSNAVLEHMRSLVRLGYRVGFVARDAAHNSKTAKTLERSGIACFGAPYFSCVEDVLRHHGGEAALVYVHRVANMALYGAMIRHLCPKARLVYSVADLHFLRQAREEAIRREPPARSRHLREQELAAARMADAVITHSSYETALLARVLPGLNVHTVPWPFEASGSAIPFSQRAGLAFIGSYDHRPNLDAATYLVKVVMPLVWRQAPSIDCLLVGSHMPETMRRLTSERVVAMGHVPDLDGLFDEIRLTVAPLRFGAGLKGKVLQSLAAGIPCVCTTIAAEGMDLPADLAGLVGQNAEELAALILRLHNNAGENARYGAAGIEFVERQLQPVTIDHLMGAAVTASTHGIRGSNAYSRIA
jgi:autotransporter passenger strand-loop-strand repeat protein